MVVGLQSMVYLDGVEFMKRLSKRVFERGKGNAFRALGERLASSGT
jgi:hypothetical protein